MIEAGIFGTPVAIPFERTALDEGQLLLATTDTVDPPGIEAGNCMVQLVVLPVTIAPATLVVHVYVAAPGTAAMLNVEVAFGHG